MIADLRGFDLAIGHATDEAGGTGLTVIRGTTGPLRGAVAVFGRATGSRELHTLEPGHVTDGRVDALLLSGGSAYGLDAAAGVMRWLEERKRGFPVGGGVVPIVPAAVIFDLSYKRFDARPTAAMAYDAMERASTSEIQEGSVGAGTGATVGKISGPAAAMKGGFGCWVARSGDLAVAAFAVVNALGDVRDAQGRVVAGARSSGRGHRDEDFLDTTRALTGEHVAPARDFSDLALQNTTLAAVCANVSFDGLRLAQLARASFAAVSRRVTPAGSMYDGDVVFALCPPSNASTDVDSLVVEALAVQALETAIERGVLLAHGDTDIPGRADGAHAR